jgi:hypothetical protein
LDVQDGGSLLLLPTLSAAEVVDPYAPIDVLEPLVWFCWLGNSDNDSDDRASASGLRRKGLESCRWSDGSSPCRLPKRMLSPSLGEDSTDRLLRPILPGMEECRASGRKDPGGVGEPAVLWPPPGDRRRCIICLALTSRDVCGEGGGTSESKDEASGGHTDRPSYEE